MRRVLERVRETVEGGRVFKSFGALSFNAGRVTGEDAPALGGAQPRPTPESVWDFNRPTWVADIDLPWPVSPEGDKALAPSEVGNLWGRDSAHRNPMKIQFHIRGVDINARARNSLKKWLERLHSLIPITAAAVALEHNRNDAPAFRAFVLLAVPGPDIHAEARDHTLGAAWLKVNAALRKQIQQRKAKQLARIKSMGQQPMFTAPWLRGGVPKLISLKTIKRVAIILIGSTVLAIGVALLVLPGPAVIVIPAGLAILAIEFAWARRWLHKARHLLPNKNGTRGFPAFVARRTRNFLGWASARPQEDTEKQDRMKGQKDETQKQSESTVTGRKPSQRGRGRASRL
jgi:ribosome-associated translation inhibitor RaiA